MKSRSIWIYKGEDKDSAMDLLTKIANEYSNVYSHDKLVKENVKSYVTTDNVYLRTNDCAGIFSSRLDMTSEKYIIASSIEQAISKYEQIYHADFSSLNIIDLENGVIYFQNKY